LSNLGKWDRWHALIGDEPAPFGLSVTYELGAQWLAGCDRIEDWGCGRGWLSRLIPPDRYCGIDGSRTPFADVIADLAVYRSTVPGVFIRHVLEHNRQWAEILDNALASATERLFVAIFTPLAERTLQIAFASDLGVPDISFRLADLTDRIDAAGFGWTAETLETPTQYGVETVPRCKR
jgi:hypothetical protein